MSATTIPREHLDDPDHLRDCIERLAAELPLPDAHRYRLWYELDAAGETSLHLHTEAVPHAVPGRHYPPVIEPTTQHKP